MNRNIKYNTTYRNSWTLRKHATSVHRVLVLTFQHVFHTNIQKCYYKRFEACIYQ